MDIEYIRTKAKAGDIDSQKALAHAYLTGDGVSKNRSHYLSWLTKAAEQGDLESQLELIGFYSNKRSKFSSPEKALYWMRKAKELGAEFSIDQMAEVGDSSACSNKIERFLFGSGEDHNFKKAKDLLLKCNLPQTTLRNYANRYYEIYKNNTREIPNICYLIKKAYNRNGEDLNDYAVELTRVKSKNNMKIAFSLFGEAYSLGCTKAAGSYLYCLLEGKGCTRNLSRAASFYFECRRKNIDTDWAFASSNGNGSALEFPSSFAWHMFCVKHYIHEIMGKVCNVTANFFSVPLLYLRSALKVIDLRVFSLSALILSCIFFFDLSWLQSLRQVIEGLLPCPAYLTYALLFVALTATFSLIFKITDNYTHAKRNKEFRQKLKRDLGWDFPEFNIESARDIHRSDGCNGGCTNITTEYVLRFKSGKYQDTWAKEADSQNCYISKAELERIDDYTVKITIYYTYD